MLNITALRRAIPVMAAVTVLFVIVSALLGSDGPTDADETLGQQIANVAFIGIFLALLLLLLLVLAYGLATARERRRR
jgi:NADH:ubiquinone oxidoreductase subunit 6 (subunit J)